MTGEVLAADEAVKAIQDNADRLGLLWQIRFGTVTIGSDPAAVQVVMDADTVPITAVSLIGVMGFGARVAVIQVPPTVNYVIGRLGVSVPSNSESINDVMGADTTTSAAYVNLAAPSSLTFTKRNDDTRLYCDLNVVVSATVAAARADFAIEVDGTDNDIIAFFISGITVNQSVSGVLHISNVAAGTYTVQVRWKRGSGVGTLSVGTPNRLSLGVFEVA